MRPLRTVLIVDDEAYVRDSVKALVEAHGDHRALTADSVAAAVELLGRESVDVVLADLQMPDGGAQELLETMGLIGSRVPVIVVTGVGTVPRAVAAMKAGAFDFVQKPIEPDALLHLLSRALEHRRLVSDVTFLRRALDGQRQQLVGESRAMQRVREQVAQVAATDATVLLTGESGTGKELVAEAIHRASPRGTGHLVRINCAAVPDTLFESEFFGHRRGSFSGASEDRLGRFAEAEGGTLELDEIGTLRPEMQAKLLRVLENGEYQMVGEAGTRVADARIIAITNEELDALVDKGHFRRDLYYRLAIFPIEVPPLRDRRDDIVPISRHLLETLRGRPPSDAELGRDVAAVLEAYEWPGNVRELRNVLERATIIVRDEPLDPDVFRAVLESSMPLAQRGEAQTLHLRTRLLQAERDLVSEALSQAGGRRKEAAKMLGIDSRNLAYYLRKHDLQDAPSA